MVKFNVVLEKEEEGGYSVHCPAIKGCHSQGDTIEEAIKNIKEAIEGCLEVMNARALKAIGKYHHPLIKSLKVAVSGA
jgi:predicted RNase H-like HicB family nuclease